MLCPNRGLSPSVKLTSKKAHVFMPPREVRKARVVQPGSTVHDCSAEHHAVPTAGPPADNILIAQIGKINIEISTCSLLGSSKLKHV